MSLLASTHLQQYVVGQYASLVFLGLGPQAGDTVVAEGLRVFIVGGLWRRAALSRRRGRGAAGWRTLGLVEKGLVNQ